MSWSSEMTVIGLRRTRYSPAEPKALGETGFALLGTLHTNTEDGLADFRALREPTRSRSR